MSTEPVLRVTVCSFGFGRSGAPPLCADGGGFVFDCRGIENPGLLQQFASKTGLDSDVKDFLDQHTAMPRFLHAIFELLTVAIVEHRQRGHTRVQVAFGCTGGQHRSVYAAEETKAWLALFGGDRLSIDIIHTERDGWP